MSARRAAVAAVAALWAVTVSAEPPGEEAYRADDQQNHEARWEGFSVFTDQDVFFPPAFDQDYTMGLEFVCQGRWVRDWKLVVPLPGVDWLSGLGGLHHELQQDRVPTSESPSQRPDLLGFASHSVHFGNSAFTPGKATLGLTEPIHDDRPYASLLYLKVRRTSARGSRALVSDLSVGMLTACASASGYRRRSTKRAETSCPVAGPTRSPTAASRRSSTGCRPVGSCWGRRPARRDDPSTWTWPSPWRRTRVITPTWAPEGASAWGSSDRHGGASSGTPSPT